jgi:hypothetical protein
MTLDIAGGPRQVLPHHLMLVPSDAPTSGADGEAECGANDAAGPKHRRPDAPASSSATMRALMALGAIAAALGLSNCQQALGSVVHGKAPATRPDEEAGGEASITFTGHAPGYVKRPVIGTAVSEVRRTVPAATEPTSRPTAAAADRTVIPVAYTLPEGAGKHRKPAVKDAAESCAAHSGYVGKHRHDAAAYGDRHRSRHERDRNTRTTTGPKQAATQTGPGMSHRRGSHRRSV